VLVLSAMLPPLLCCPAWAAKWDIVPSLSVSETYTDNLSLTQDALKESDFVTQVTPAISIAATGARLRLNADYSPEFSYYGRGRRDNQTYQRLRATGNAELAEQLLFVDASAGINQYNISLQGPTSTSTVNTTGNIATVRTFSVSPYVLRDIGSELQAEARLTHRVADSNDARAFPDNVAGGINLRLKSGPAYRLLTWNLDYFREGIEYETQQEVFTETITANGRRLITPTVGLLVRVGYENYDSGVGASELNGEIWSAGADWTPTPRTRLAATAGRRLYGEAYSFDFQHRTRLTTWKVSYSEQITTTSSEFFVPATTSTAGYLDTLFLAQFPDPVSRQKAVEEFIAQTGLPPSLSAPVNFFSRELFLRKSWQASTGLMWVRSVLIVNVFDETRERLAGVLPGTGDFSTSNNIRQVGMSFHWNWRITPRDTWNHGGTYSRNEFPDSGRVDNVIGFRMSLTRQFQPRLAGSLNYRRQQNDSNDSLFSYTENAAVAALRVGF
jgi:uncharacterized protein (PEP-CTERM system associated)